MNTFSTMSNLEKFQSLLKQLTDFKQYDIAVKQEYPQMHTLNMLTLQVISQEAVNDWHEKLEEYFCNLHVFCQYSSGLRKVAMLCAIYVSMYLDWGFDLVVVPSYRHCVDTCFKESIENNVSIDSPLFSKFLQLIENPTSDNILQFKLQI